MNFAELRFWELLAGALAVVLGVRFFLKRLGRLPVEFDRWALLFIGLTLLFAVGRTTFVIFLVVAVGTYFGLHWILRAHGRAPRRYLLVFIPLQLAPLIYYKYADFVVNGVFSQQVDFLRHLVIPVGISFYTFQKVAFVLDTLALKQPLPRFLDYMNFAGFFPQIVAGPIERRRDLLPQMQSFRFAWKAADVDAGAGWVALGFFFKCGLADNFAELFQPVPATNAWLVWVNNVIFGLRIYYDFAGYSMIALGLARALGIKLTLNFASPYCAANATEFWRRWHVTLSQWFRDYVYVPLGGGRVAWWAANVLIVFLISGLWHGAGWNFVLWGVLHGAFLILHRLLGAWVVLPAVAGWLLTMAAVFLAWLCFYETSLPVLLLKLQTLFTPAGYSTANWQIARTTWAGANGFVLLCFVALAAATQGLEWRSLRHGGEPLAALRKTPVLVALVILTVILSPGKSNGFIYFAF